VLPTKDFEGLLWALENREGKAIQIRYDHVDTIAYYDKPQFINQSTTGTASIDGGQPYIQKFHFNQATGRKIRLQEEASASYAGDGAFTLVNGVINEKGFSRAREFLGWSGKDCEAVIDLGSTREISFVTVHALKRRSSWIWEPASAEVFASSDGVKWYSLKSVTDHQEKENQKITMTLAFRKTPARYVKVLVKNYGKIPNGNPGEGRDAWLFIDEIGIE
jgi:hexosaminidase